MNDVMKKPLSPLDSFRRELASLKIKFEGALPKNIAPEKFMSVVMTAVTMNTDLLSLDRQSLFNACLKCANDGLLPDGREAALSKAGDKVQYTPMIGGLIKRARNSGEIAVLNAEVVYEGDQFEYWIDEDGKHLKHVPNFNLVRGTADKATLAYAVCKYKTGEVDYEIMNKGEIEKVRSKSKMASGAIWKEWWGEMARKSVIRRFSKRLPMSNDLRDFVEQDDENTDLSTDLKTANSTIEELQAQLQNNASAGEIEFEMKGESGPSEFDKFDAATTVVSDPKMVK